MATPAHPLLFIVDDDEQLAGLLGVLGEAEGFDACPVMTPGDLPALAEQHPGAALVLDIVMPDMDGLELLQKLAAVGFQGPILVFSGSDPIYLDTVQRIATRQGLNLMGVAQKPMAPEHLQELLGRLRQALPEG